MTAAGYRIRFYQPGDANGLWEAARESVAEVSPWLPRCHAEGVLRNRLMLHGRPVDAVMYSLVR